jgi:hypothetical protein
MSEEPKSYIKSVYNSLNPFPLDAEIVLKAVDFVHFLRL